MKLGELVQRLGSALRIELSGDAGQEVTALAPLGRAGPQDLAFVADPRYADALATTRAGAVIVTESLAARVHGNALITPQPYTAYAEASWLLAPDKPFAPGIHASAVVDPSASIDPSAHVGPGVVIGADTVVGERVVLEACCILGERVDIASDCRLFARVTLHDGCRLGQACRIQSGAVIGGEGFGYAPGADGWRAIHQTGGVRLGDRVHVGANTTIDRGAIDDTVIDSGVILDNQIQIAHNVRIGENTAIAGCVGIAGSTVIGKRCQIGGASNIVGHIRIADDVTLNAASLVTQSIDVPGRYGSGAPLQPVKRWRRTYVTLNKLDDLLARVRRLERREQVSAQPEE